MIHIDKNTDYNEYYNEFENLYSSFYETNINLPTHPYQTKLNTPFIVTSLFVPSIISPKLIEEFKSALFYFGYLHSVVPFATKVHAQEEFKRQVGSYLIPADYFKSHEITYGLSEFGHIAQNQSTPKRSCFNFTKNQHFSLAKLFEICFSSSSFRFMLIKAECLTFLYYYFLSKYSKIPQELYSFYGAFNYAYKKASRYSPSSITFGILYVWELVTAFNHFTNMNFSPLSEDNKINLPTHHVYMYPRRLSCLSQFGKYDLTTCKYKLSLPNISEKILKHISINPQFSTDIPSNSQTLFYLPQTVDKTGILSSSFNTFIEWLIEDSDENFDEIFYRISFINNFEDAFVVNSEQPQVIDGGEFFVNTLFEADEIIRKRNIKPIKGFDLYFSIMIQDEYSKQLQNIKID